MTGSPASGVSQGSKCALLQRCNISKYLSHMKVIRIWYQVGDMKKSGWTCGSSFIPLLFQLKLIMLFVYRWGKWTETAWRICQNLLWDIATVFIVGWPWIWWSVWSGRRTGGPAGCDCLAASISGSATPVCWRWTSKWQMPTSKVFPTKIFCNK